MGRRRSTWTWELIRKRIAQGRGQGEGSNYCPWHLVQDFPSQGRSHRIKGLTVDRVHHLLSDLEADAFFIFDLPSNNIVDIREQYPLFPIAMVRTELSGDSRIVPEIVKLRMIFHRTLV